LTEGNVSFDFKLQFFYKSFCFIIYNTQVILSLKLSMNLTQKVNKISQSFYLFITSYLKVHRHLCFKFLLFWNLVRNIYIILVSYLLVESSTFLPQNCLHSISFVIYFITVISRNLVYEKRLNGKFQNDSIPKLEAILSPISS
jgi:hypothetical protein